MHKLRLLAVAVYITLTSCQNKSNDDPSPAPSASDYYISFKADNKDYVFTKPMTVINASANAGAILEAYDGPLHIDIRTGTSLSGRPESKPISDGTFAISRFDNYRPDFSRGDLGTLTITKVDNNTVEGTFLMNLYLNGQKLSLTNGQFKLKFG